MGLFGRLYRLLSAYITVTSERLERAASQVDAESKRAADEVEDILTRPAAQRQASPVGEVQPTDQARLAGAYRVLGLPGGADLRTVEERWRSLAARADPKRFPEGSHEEKKASEILRQVNEAYRELRNHLSPTGGRFEKLEI